MLGNYNVNAVSRMSRLNSGLGFSLIEVLVSVLVLAVGLLGMGGLQVSSLQNSARSVLRTQAAYLSYEILDKMRANAGQGAAYVTAASQTAMSTTNCIATACNAEILANYDVTEWRCALGQTSACDALPAASLVSDDNSLPNATGAIAINGNLYTITIQWNEQRDGSENDLQSFSLETAL